MSKSAVQFAKKTYNVKRWSEGYVDINDQGELCVNPLKRTGVNTINLATLAQQLKEEGLTLPILVRFTDILGHRASSLIDAFVAAKKERDYQGVYTAVYPIKVNQQFSVVEKLVSHPSNKVGLEAGSKPELMAILGISENPLTIVCNGYKDSEFLRLACIGQAMGHKVHIVIEKMTEVDALVEAANDIGVMPTLGIRIRLNSIGKGKWQNTGGEKGKFGLSANQVLDVIDKLKAADMLSHLNLVHFHIGSQIANIRDIHNAIRECARHYAELNQMGVPIRIIDVGGGLGVDYEGTGSRSACSMNYTMAEYAKNVISPIIEICEKFDLPHPDIITESGRAMTAHHAMLITDVIDVEKAPVPDSIEPPNEDCPSIIHELWRSYQMIDGRHALESFHDAVHLFSDAHQQYVVGLISLVHWAKVEQLYFKILSSVREELDPRSRSHREVLDEINEKLADKLFVNFSLFQSLPDVWGIDQLFPVMPIKYLDQPLENRAIIQDITCDSDGQIRSYVDGAGIESTLPLPPYTDNNDYLIGMFMVGAYQEILGDLHNLFGDTDSVHVQIDENDPRGYVFTQSLKGENVADVLAHVQYDSSKLLVSYEKQLQNADVEPIKAKQFVEELQAGLTGYTYFED